MSEIDLKFMKMSREAREEMLKEEEEKIREISKMYPISKESKPDSDKERRQR